MAQSSQKFIARSRSPRVRIEYDVELYGAEKRVEVPFVLGVLADLAGSPARPPPSLEERRMLQIDIDNFDDRLRATEPRVAFSVPSALVDGENLDVDITFTCMDDFAPAAVANKVAGPDLLLKQRTQLTHLVAYMDGKHGASQLVERLLNDQSLLEQIAAKGERSPDYGANTAAGDFVKHVVEEFRPRSDSALQSLESALRTLAVHALASSAPLGADPESAVRTIVQNLDHKLTLELNRIVHHPDFQRLEGAWRGLYYLTEHVEADQTLITRFISISKEELRRAIGRYLGTAWDQSPLFKKICVEEYSMFGGQPYACLIGDYEFNHSPPDVEILTGTARIAAAAHAPFLAAASPSVMQMESWQEIAHPRSISKVFSTVEYAAWRSLRKTEESAYVGLTMPRFLARLPYGTESNQVEEFDFREDYGGRESRCYTWCNSAYAMGANIARAFKLYGWCARISGVESGGLVEDLPTHCFPADDGGMENRSPSEISISDRWEAELARNGFIPLVHLKNSDSAAFIGARSFHEPPTYDDPDLTAASALASRLPFRLTSCRFAQYMKCIVRDWIGSFKDRADMQEWLNRWIRGYVDSDPASSSEEGKARRPLADAEIVLDEIEGDPCHYRSKLYIRPHYQLEGLTVSLRLVSELPSEHPA